MFAVSGLTAQEQLFGNVAERYLIWAEAKLAAGSPAEALAGLERGADYAPVSADLLYLLAYTRKIQGVPAGFVLQACASALENGRWGRYSATACRLLEAETLVQLRDYGRALLLLESVDEARSPVPVSSAESGGRGVQEAYPDVSGLLPESRLLRLRALRGLERHDEFIRLMEEALERFPRDPRFLRLLFDYMGEHSPSPALRSLSTLALRRLPCLVEDAPDLAYIASPFIADREEAARYVASYRAAGNPNPANIPQALFWGLIGDEQAVNELFSRDAARFGQQVLREDPAPGRDRMQAEGRTQGEGLIGEPALDKALVLAVWNNIRGKEGRDKLRRNHLSYSGVIKEDADKDGFFEISVAYRNGLLWSYSWDADQDGLSEWDIRFGAGIPLEAGISMPASDPVRMYPDSQAYPARSAAGLVDYTKTPDFRKKALVRWERYPAVLHTDYDGVRYIPRPADFFFSPVRFAELVPEGPLYPERDKRGAGLNERSLLSFSVMTEKESAEFPGGVERIMFRDAMPLRSTVYLDGKIAAETEFSPSGYPVVQRADVDLDGRMETIRQYSRSSYGLVVSTESDWDGDGLYEYAEVLQADATLKRYWDLDKDGTRETER
jgi:tetratricopeptide (TPR) repeat protein